MEQLGKRILVVDDHIDCRNVVALVLRRQGYSVETVGTGGEALQMCKTFPFDLLIGDVGLPDMSGNDLMRDIARMYNIKGIAYSGYGREDEVRSAIEAGYSAHLVKPVSIDVLQATVERMIGR